MANIEKKEFANLTAAVRNGAGLAGFHGGMCDAFRDATEYQFMCGGQWVAHPGNIIDYRVNITRRTIRSCTASTISTIAPSSTTCTWTRPTRCSRLPILTRTCDWIEGAVMPVVWKRRMALGGSSTARSATSPPNSTCRRCAPCSARDAVGGAVIRNPILPGFNPDPSICRVGPDYYIAVSTFEWYPGVQIHHSRDLVNWTLVARPLTRAAQLDMRGNPDSCGIWAPCLSHADGLFWLVYTDVKRYDGNFKDTHNYIVTAPAITGRGATRCT